MSEGEKPESGQEDKKRTQLRFILLSFVVAVLYPGPATSAGNNGLCHLSSCLAHDRAQACQSQ